jgi:hypothetical protein
MYSSSSVRDAIERFAKTRLHWVALDLFEMEPDSGEDEPLDLGLDLRLYQMENFVT